MMSFNKVTDTSWKHMNDKTRRIWKMSRTDQHTLYVKLRTILLTAAKYIHKFYQIPAREWRSHRPIKKRFKYSLLIQNVSVQYFLQNTAWIFGVMVRSNLK